MNLIIATGIYPPDIGGPATYSKKIAEEFSRRGWDVKIITYANLRECESESMRNDANKIVRISKAHNVMTRYFLYTWNLIKLAKNADLIYAQGPVSEGLPVFIASKVTGRKYILRIGGDTVWERFLSKKQQNKKAKKQMDIDDMDVETRPACAGRFIASERTFIALDEFQNAKGLPWNMRILKWIKRFVARHAVKIIVPSKCLEKTVAMWGVDTGKIKVIYNSAEEGNWQIPNSKFQISKVGEGDIILSAGRLITLKGFDALIDLMPKLLEVNKNFKLVIVGDGPKMASLKSKVQSQKSYDNKIILTGKMEHNELLQYMQKAEIFVLNSCYEGLSNTVIEAMQSGLPCAVSNVGGNPELVENEKSGLLFEYNNKEQIKQAIARLWRDVELRKIIIAGGFEKVKEFSYERMIDDTEEILNSKF